MKDTLQPGLSLEHSHSVTDAMAPAHLPVKVLSTPSMVQLIEATCYACAQPHLDSNESTVGTHICVSHAAAARSGETVAVKVTLREINKRRLKFEVAVVGAAGPISLGTHERAVIDLDRMRGRTAG